MLVYGDSNSAAAPPSGGQSWPARFATRIAGESAGSSIVTTRAIGTQRMHLCRNMTAAVTPIETFGIADLTAIASTGSLPTRVVLCAGTNDLPDNMPEAEVEDWLQSYAVFDETVRNRWNLPVYVISILPMRPGGTLSQSIWEQREARRLKANSRLATLFGPTGRFFNADSVVGEGVASAVPGSVQIWSPYVFDPLHINWTGHVRLADALPLAWG